MYIVIGLIVGVACAYASANIATKKGYAPTLYAVLGFVLGLIGLVIIAVMPDKSNEALNKDAATAEALANYKKLLDDGVITEEEFAEKKAQLLGS